MENNELRELQELYLQESNAFLECLKQEFHGIFWIKSVKKSGRYHA